MRPTSRGTSATSRASPTARDPRVAPPSLGDATGDPYATHQAQHPPLFYLLGAPVYKLTALGADTEAAKFALRLVSLVFGLATLCLTHALLRRVWPESDIVTLGVPAFVAFTPLFGLMSGVVNNDGLGSCRPPPYFFFWNATRTGRAGRTDGRRPSRSAWRR